MLSVFFDSNNMFTTTAATQNAKISQHYKAKMSGRCKKQQDRAMHAGRFQAFTKISHTVLIYYIHKTCCKNLSLSYYHCVINASLPQFLPCQFYHQFSAIIHPVKQSHDVIYLEATDLLYSHWKTDTFVFVSPESILTDSTTARYTSRDVNFKGYYNRACQIKVVICTLMICLIYLSSGVVRIYKANHSCPCYNYHV